MKYLSISIDTYDFVVIAAMIGGFITHNWVPFVFFVLYAIAADFLPNKKYTSNCP